ncbi:MAG: aldo/keto reductase [Anaerolineales bacterium]|jgi:aryl-alcohol dehydrogenase-like predicted oxidoreductase
MQYRNLGRTGLKVSELCLGSMQFGWTADETAAQRVLSAAYEAGINFIDTADVYSRWVEGNPGGVAESIIGDWMHENSIPRDKLVLATKVRAPVGDGPNDQGLSRAHIFNAVEASLKRLKTDYIDLYQTHYFDENTPIAETMIALDDLVRQGKVRYLGCSNYPAWRLMSALWASDRRGLARYNSLQPHYNLVHRAEFERELAQVCRQYGLGVIPYSPLAGGFLTGKYRPDSQPDSARSGGVRRYFNDRNWKLLEVMDELAQKKGASLSQLAIAWLMADPLVTSPIIGPRNLEQLQDNLGSIDVHLNENEKNALDEASAWEQ